MSRRGDPESGAAAVEFAILLPVLILLIIGMVDFGAAYNAKISLTQAARESVRRVALGLATTQPEVEAAANYAAPTLQNNATATVSSWCLAPVSPTDNATVVLDYTYTMVVPMPIPGFPTTVSLSSRAVMRCSG